MKTLPNAQTTADEQAFWAKVIYSDKTWVSVMVVAMVVGLLVELV